jgi:hypothetical protein
MANLFSNPAALAAEAAAAPGFREAAAAQDADAVARVVAARAAAVRRGDRLRNPRNFLAAEQPIQVRQQPRPAPRITGILANTVPPKELRKRANELHLPLEMSRLNVNDANPADYARLFDTRFTDMCTMILGSKTIRRIKEMRTPTGRQLYPTMRNFFEKSNPTTQCNNTFGAFVPGTSVCWICNLGIGAGEQECEHKLAVILALVFSGLYDSTLADDLSEEKRQEYVTLLNAEYAWSHVRCNQQKTDHPYIIDVNPAENAAALVTLDVNRRLIDQDLIAIHGDGGRTPPTAAAIRTAIGAAGLTEATWRAQRLGGDPNSIASQLQVFLARYTGVYTKQAVYARFKYGLLSRAAILGPLRFRNLGAHYRSIASLQTLLRAPQGGARHTTPRSSRRRKTYRGGDPPDIAPIVEALYEETLEIVHQLALAKIIAFEMDKTPSDAAAISKDGDAIKAINDVITARAERFREATGVTFLQTTSDIAWDSLLYALSWTEDMEPFVTLLLGDILVSLGYIPNKDEPVNVVAVLDAIETRRAADEAKQGVPRGDDDEEEDGEGAGGPMRRTISPVRMSGPLPAKGDASPPATIRGSLGSPMGTLESPLSQPVFTTPIGLRQRRRGEPTGMTDDDTTSDQGSTPSKPKTEGGFKFSLGKRPNWL